MEGAPSTICPGCKDIALLAEKVVTCERCETTYHESCWHQQGSRCTTAGCEDVVPKNLEKQLTPRSGNLPMRVQSGELGPGGFRINTSGGVGRLVPWSEFEFIASGVIELDLTMETPRSAMRAMLRKLMGDQGQPQHHLRQIRETYLVDIFLTGQDAPLRIDSSAINYRSLLGEVSQASHRNFLQLLNKLVQWAGECRLDGSTVALITSKRYAIKHYASVYEFEMEAHICRQRPAEHTFAKDVKIPEGGGVKIAEWEE
ncbi:MAG TPA: hypothetical protein VGO93_10590 [Candidatus Xenobia bacterium]|jgi:hypothetical protein